MEEKNTRSRVSSWIIVGVAFVGLIIFLLFKFLRDGRESVISQCQDRMIMYTSSWADGVSVEAVIASQFGEMMASCAEKSIGFADEGMCDFANDIVTQTDFAHIVFCENGIAVGDENGKVVNGQDHSELINDGEMLHILPKGNMYCNESGLTYTKELGPNQAVIFFIHSAEIAARFKESSYEDVSFVALVTRNGDILTVFDKYKDVDSMFVKESNILAPIMQNANKNKYNIFKVKLINNLDAVISVTYKGDARTIAFSPTGIQNIYVAYGVRQNVFDKQVKVLFRDVQATVIKLSAVMLVFTMFVICTLIFTALRSKERGKELEDKADTDLLTDLYNKAATERKIQEYIAENPNGRALMFILDIDNFKKVNDTMGHSFGDTLLKTLGKEIKTEFRTTDIIGRTGGDEFMVFLKDVQDDLIVEREANRLTQFFHDFKAGGDYVKYSASASIGAAIFPDDAKNFKNLYVAADQALYRAKKRGKNQLVFYNETVHKI